MLAQARDWSGEPAPMRVRSGHRMRPRCPRQYLDQLTGPIDVQPMSVASMAVVAAAPVGPGSNRNGDCELAILEAIALPVVSTSEGDGDHWPSGRQHWTAVTTMRTIAGRVGSVQPDSSHQRGLLAVCCCVGVRTVHALPPTGSRARCNGADRSKHPRGKSPADRTSTLKMAFPDPGVNSPGGALRSSPRPSHVKQGDGLTPVG